METRINPYRISKTQTCVRLAVLKPHQIPYYIPVIPSLTSNIYACFRHAEILSKLKETNLEIVIKLETRPTHNTLYYLCGKRHMWLTFLASNHSMTLQLFTIISMVFPKYWPDDRLNSEHLSHPRIEFKSEQICVWARSHTEVIMFPQRRRLQWTHLGFFVL